MPVIHVHTSFKLNLGSTKGIVSFSVGRHSVTDEVANHPYTRPHVSLDDEDESLEEEIDEKEAVDEGADEEETEKSDDEESVDEEKGQGDSAHETRAARRRRRRRG